MYLYLIRHGQAETGGRLAGHTDYPLSIEGSAQAAALARHFQDQPLTRLFTSSLQRAASTAEPLASATGLTAEVWPELIERSGGLFQGWSLEEANKHYPALFAHAWDNPLIAPPFGESYADVATRVARFQEHLYGLADDEVVAVVAHNGSLNVLLHQLLGLSPDVANFPKYKWSTTGVTLVSLSSDRIASVLTHNQTDHLSSLTSSYQLE